MAYNIQGEAQQQLKNRRWREKKEYNINTRIRGFFICYNIQKEDGSDGGFHHFSTGSGGGGGQRALCAGIIISEPISYRRS
jgi:hypothetical protein